MARTKEGVKKYYGALFSVHIRDLRESRRWTQRDLAALLGVSQPVVAAWESQGRLPPLSTVLLLADVLGVGVESLIGDVGRRKQLGERLWSAFGQGPLSRGSILEILEIVVAVLELPKEAQVAALDSLRIVSGVTRAVGRRRRTRGGRLT
jgi:transcriptional regulator with XRE-family HTH domain